MRKANFCFDQNQRKENLANQKAKKNNNQFESKKKDFVPNRNFKNNKEKNYCNNKNFQGNKRNTSSNQNNSKGKEFANNHGNFTKSFERKDPIKCWECNGPRYASQSIQT